MGWCCEGGWGVCYWCEWGWVWVGSLKNGGGVKGGGVWVGGLSGVLKMGGERGVKSGGRGVVGRVGRLIWGGCSDEE